MSTRGLGNLANEQVPRVVTPPVRYYSRPAPPGGEEGEEMWAMMDGSAQGMDPPLSPGKIHD